MKMVFRVHYHTRPGESLWLHFAAWFEAGGVRVAEWLPMRWVGGGQWECRMGLDGRGPLRLDYHYQLRREAHGVVLDEWRVPRVLRLDAAVRDTVVLLDAWSSAGTVDSLYETAAFSRLLTARGGFVEPVERHANHRFCLRMAAVPAGQVPCLSGSVAELGGWDPARVVLLEEVAANRWQAQVNLPAGWQVEYKYGLWDLAEGRLQALEEGCNRVLAAHDEGARQWTVVNDEGYNRAPGARFRGAGVAVPVFSLRSERGCGVGEFADLKALGDWAARAGLAMIQVLPVNDTTSAGDWTDSYPYAAVSVYALHPLYLRLDDLPYPMPASFHRELGGLREELNRLQAVDYEAVLAGKHRLLRQVYRAHRGQILTDQGFRRFFRGNRGWLAPYVAFCVLRDRHGSGDPSAWGEWVRYDAERVAALVDEGHAEWAETAYAVWLQYELDRQLRDAVDHLHRCGVVLKGDLPIGVHRQSVEVWSQPGNFHLGMQAGAPPDAFAPKGQNWGFPTYNWEAMKADGYAWWRGRLGYLGRYFDAFRIDHILGFFRIWTVPWEQVEGVMGWFDPAMPLHLEEILARGIPWDFNRYCRPYIREHSLAGRFGVELERVCAGFIEPCGHGYWKLRERVGTQRRIVEAFRHVDGLEGLARERELALRQALLDCAAEVLLLEVPGSGGRLFHPRCNLRETASFQELDGDVQWRMAEMHDDYFHRRHEAYWEACGLEKLPALRRASGMLLCGEDLGMVPACVPGVMAELGFLSLEIQRMPKRSGVEHAHPADAPYASVVSPSTHDMEPLRGWWREDAGVTGRFAWSALGEAFPPLELGGEMAGRIINQHLASPAMWAVFPLQDLLAMDERLRHPDAGGERINVPAVVPHYWRWRMHLTLERLGAEDGFSGLLAQLIEKSGRRVVRVG